MKAQRLKLWRRGRIGWLIGLTIVAGLTGGILLNRALHAIPTAKHRSIPRLIHNLEKQDSTLDKIWQTAWPVLPDVLTSRLPGFQPRPAASLRREAAEELKSRGPEAQAAVPALVGALNDADVHLCSSAIQALAQIGPLAAAAVPNLIALLQTPKKAAPRTASLDLRGEAVLALAAIAPKDARVLVLLNQVVRIKDYSGLFGVPPIQSYAITALERIAATNQSAIPILIAALKESGTEFEAIQRPQIGIGIGYGNSDSDVAVFRAWQAQQERVGLKAQIIGALGRIGPKTPEVVPTLLAVLQSRNDRICVSGIEALGNIGPQAGSAVPALLELVAKERTEYPDPEEGLRPAPPAGSNLYGLRQFGPPKPMPAPPQKLNQGIPMLLRLQPLGPEPPSVSYSALPYRILESLGKIGRGAEAAIPLLMDEARNPTSLFRFDAAMARWQIDHRTEDALPVLRDGLGHADEMLRRRIAGFLSSMGPEALPEMTAALSNDDMRVRIIAIKFFAALGPAARTAVPLLEQACSDLKYVVRAAAEEALKQIKPQPMDGRPAGRPSKSADENRSR